MRERAGIDRVGLHARGGDRAGAQRVRGVHVKAGVLEQLREPFPAVGRLRRDVRAVGIAEQLEDRLAPGRDPLLQRQLALLVDDRDLRPEAVQVDADPPRRVRHGRSSSRIVRPRGHHPRGPRRCGSGRRADFLPPAGSTPIGSLRPRPLMTSTVDGVIGCRPIVKRFAFGRWGCLFGGGGAEHPLNAGEVGAEPRGRGLPDSDVLLRDGGQVVGHAVLPVAPEDAQPCASDGADRAGVVAVAMGSGAVLLSLGIAVACAVGECADGVAQALVAARAEARELAIAGSDRDWGHAGVVGERVGGGVAVAAVSDLAQQRRRAGDAVAVFEQGEEDLVVRVSAEAVRDLRAQLGDLGHQRAQGCDERERDLAASRELLFARVSFGGASRLAQQVAGPLAPPVAVPGEESGQSLLAQAASIELDGVALEEGERDRAIGIGEELDRAWPEPLKLGAKQVRQSCARLNVVLARLRQGSHRLCLLAVGHKHPGNGARRCARARKAQRRRSACRRGPEARLGRGDLRRAHRNHVKASVEQSLDQQPISSLPSDRPHIHAHQRAAPRCQPRFTMREFRGQEPLGRLARGLQIVASPTPTSQRRGSFPPYSSSFRITSQRLTTRYRCGVLLDRPSSGLRALAACGTWHRRVGTVSCCPNGESFLPTGSGERRVPVSAAGLTDVLRIVPNRRATAAQAINESSIGAGQNVVSASM